MTLSDQARDAAALSALETAAIERMRALVGPGVLCPACGATFDTMPLLCRDPKLGCAGWAAIRSKAVN